MLRNEPVRFGRGSSGPVQETPPDGLPRSSGTTPTPGANGRPRAPRTGSTSTTSPTRAGKADPYGVYDVAANTGWVSVGTDGDTAAFAVETIRRWWRTVGHAAYPDATRLLITADAGGSNGYRLRLWKNELAALAAQIGLPITVCHLPPEPPNGTGSSTACSATSR